MSESGTDTLEPRDENERALLATEGWAYIMCPAIAQRVVELGLPPKGHNKGEYAVFLVTRQMVDTRRRA